MSQLASIARAFWWRNPFQHALALAVLILGLGTMLLGGRSLHPTIAGIVTIVTLCLPCMILLTIYTFGNDLDLTSTSSAFPRWWLTLPVRSPFLACFPVAALALSFSATWFLWCHVTRLISNREIDAPVLVPLLVAIGVGSWMQTIAWRPTAHPLIRFGTLIAFAVTTVLLIALLIDEAFSVQLWLAGPYAVLGLASAVLSVNASRVSTSPRIFGCVYQLWSTPNFKQLLAIPERPLVGKSSSLLWRDRTQLGKWMAMGAMLLTSLLFWAVWNNPKQPSVTAMCLMPLFWFSAFSSNSGRTAFFKGKCELPIYLGILPIRTKELVWARYRSLYESVTWAYAYVFILFALWYLWHHHSFNGWMLQLNNRHGTGAGMRLAIAFITAVLFTTYSVTGKHMWLTLAGRPRLEAIVVISFYSIVILGSICFANAWRMPTTDTEFQVFLSQAKDVAQIIACIVIAIKLLLALGAWAYALKLNLVDNSDVAKCIGASTAIAIAVVVALVCLLPPGMLTPIQVMLATAMLIPVASPAINVLALDFNRHR